MTPTRFAQKNLAAEVRAIEEGHRAVLQDDGTILVVSDTHHGKAYRVRTLPCRAGETVTFLCEPEGDACYSDDHQTAQGTGVVPCKHAALLARRLEREGLVRLAPWGQWIATAKAIAAPAVPIGYDPFDGLPS